jgi:hypothetical protein
LGNWGNLAALFRLNQFSGARTGNARYSFADENDPRQFVMTNASHHALKQDKGLDAMQLAAGAPGVHQYLLIGACAGTGY